MMGKFKTRISQKVIKNSFSIITLYQLQVFDIIVIFSLAQEEKKYLNFPTREQECKRKQNVLVSSSARYIRKVSVSSVDGM